MPESGTIDPMFILRHVQEKILERNRKRYWTFVDLEKAYVIEYQDRCHTGVYDSYKGISEQLVMVIKCTTEQ